MVIYITSGSVRVLDLGGSMCSGVCVGMLDGSSSKLGDAADDDSSKLGGVADDSPRTPQKLAQANWGMQ